VYPQTTYILIETEHRLRTTPNNRTLIIYSVILGPCINRWCYVQCNALMR